MQTCVNAERRHSTLFLFRQPTHWRQEIFKFCSRQYLKYTRNICFYIDVKLNSTADVRNNHMILKSSMDTPMMKKHNSRRLRIRLIIEG